MSYRRHAEFRKMLKETSVRDQDTHKQTLIKSKSVNQLPPKNATNKIVEYHVVHEQNHTSPHHQKTETKIIERTSKSPNHVEQKREAHVHTSSAHNGTHEHAKASSRPDNAERPSKSPSVRDRKYHKMCMCQICTCNRPDHLCPANYHKKGNTGISEHKDKYTPMSPHKPVIWKADDNLRTGEGPTGTTNYNNDYTKKSLPHGHVTNDQLINTIVENNVRSHIKTLINSPHEFRRAKSQTPLDVYHKPESYIKPPYQPARYKQTTKETVYKHDYPGYKNNYEGFTKLNYDNLAAHNPNVRFEGNTVYRLEHNLKQNSKPLNDQMGEMIREMNKYTHPIYPHTDRINSTEYKAEYPKKSVEHHHCAIYDLPPVASDLKKDVNHVYYDHQHKEWVK